MNLKVEIDAQSGFCGGVIRAIEGAEQNLNKARVYSLGAVVHNEAELQRLKHKGLEVVDINGLYNLQRNANVLIRAHGEPPSTYAKIKELELNILDYTCPVVLKLQNNIAKAYNSISKLGGKIVIFGKIGHAEVLGLVGQTNGEAIVVETIDMLNNLINSNLINLRLPIEIFSQTTKDAKEYDRLCIVLKQKMCDINSLSEQELFGKQMLKINQTICNQVSNRYKALKEFAATHDVIIFVSGKQSSNGKVLYNLCKEANHRTYNITSAIEIMPQWFNNNDFVGVCGATSTPKWLLEEVANSLLSIK